MRKEKVLLDVTELKACGKTKFALFVAQSTAMQHRVANKSQIDDTCGGVFAVN
jgi:hypothetical protein